MAYLNRRPAISLVSLLALLLGGALAAHRGHGRAQPLPTLVLSAAPVLPPRPAPDLVGLDPQAAKLQGDQLVQRLPDGRRLAFTLDPNLQQHAESLLREYAIPYGAIVMYELHSGAMLVMAGRAERDSRLGARELCLTPWAPAASVYKLVTASALLSRGVSATTPVCYHGGLRGLEAEHLRDQPRIDRTCHTLADAVAHSINPVIAKLAARHLDRAALLDWSTRFGFNQPIPFELAVTPSQADLPTSELELARTAAGFWHTALSPLHGAVIAGVAASGGLLRWPHLLRDDADASATKRGSSAREVRVLNRTVAARLTAMMKRTTTQGSARRGFVGRAGRLYLPDLPVAGKTGSLARRDPQLDYSWFVGFAPADHPEVAFAVLLANPPRWRIKASTTARLLLQRYLTRRRPRG
ncbi:MAG: penicillin-binding protein [Proteobacteria bacterium]|nr:penicillin-binding protein [Pseudomonadota bacterium]